MKSLLFIPLIFLLVDVTSPEIGGLAYVNVLDNLTDEQFERLFVPQIKYISVQVIVGQGKGKETERIKGLGKAGKKVIIQFWWGPSGRYNWSYHCLPAIAYDKEAQKDFFEGVDKTIDAIGAKNIYGAHLLEELFYFGIDIDKAGNWELNKYGITDGREDGSAYTNSPYANPSSCSWSAFAPNLKRFNHIFQKDTGLDMNESSIWTGEENYVFHRWAEITSAKAEVSFFKHLKKKYPNIKRFTWSVPSYPNYNGSDFAVLRENLDGVICDPYSSPNINYHYYSAFRTLCPDVELIVLLYGGYGSKDDKRAKMTAAYVAGARGIGFFEGNKEGKYYYEGNIRQGGEGMDYEDSSTWKINTSLISEFKNLPIFNKKKGPILLVSGNIDMNWFTSVLVFTGLKSFDVVPSGSAYLIDPKDYDLVIVHDDTFSKHSYFYEKYKVAGPGLDEDKIEDYVKSGGILFISGNSSIPSFLKDYIEISIDSEKQEIRYNEYELLIRRYKKVIIKKELDVKEDLGYFIPYGEGIVYYFPFSYGEEKNFTPLYNNFRKLIADILRGLLIYKGKKEIAKESIADKNSGYQYIEVKDKDILAYFQFYIGDMKPTEFKIQGIDILTGEENPKFSSEKTAIIIKKE